MQFEANGDATSESPSQGATKFAPTPEDDSRQRERHIPKISRRIRACTECKRHKVRCDMNAGESVCQRCRRMGLECVVNKSLQTLLQDEAEWKTMMELVVTDLLKKAQLPDLSYYQASNESPETWSKNGNRKASTTSIDDSKTVLLNDSRVDSPNANGGGAIQPSSSNYAPSRQQPHYTLEKGEDNEVSSLVTAPMGSLYEVTQLGELRGNSLAHQFVSDRALVTDFISRGVVQLQEAEELFSNFNQVLNRYLWDGVVLVHKDLTSVRMSSSLLAAAILTVTALHMPDKEQTFDKCYKEFSRLASESMLCHHHTLDDLRALCIGAFWLADLSWKLSGYAVRIATELNLHQCYRKAIRGSPEHREQARLWYVLYTLEHHYSIAYGRPPIIHEDSAITNHKTWTSSSTTSQSDIRLHCQVDLFIILSRVYHFFGPDVDMEVPEGDVPMIDRFNADFDVWRAAWLPRLGENRYIGTYPYKCVYLHYDFSRLQLNSVALRAYHSSSSTRMLSPARKKHANIAIEAAIATLRTILDDPHMRKALVGVPLYLHCMITFAAVFLLKIAAKVCSNGVPGMFDQRNSIASAGLLLDISYVRDLVSQTVELMLTCGERASDRHLSNHIARGLKKMLAGLEEWEKRCTCSQQPHGQMPQVTPSIFEPISITGAHPLGEPHAVPLSHPPSLGMAPLSAERNNGIISQEPGVSEGSLNPTTFDWWGFDEEFFPTGVFDFLQSQMPA